MLVRLVFNAGVRVGGVNFQLTRVSLYAKQ